MGASKLDGNRTVPNIHVYGIQGINVNALSDGHVGSKLELKKRGVPSMGFSPTHPE